MLPRIPQLELALANGALRMRGLNSGPGKSQCRRQLFRLHDIPNSIQLIPTQFWADHQTITLPSNQITQSIIFRSYIAV